MASKVDSGERELDTADFAALRAVTTRWRDNDMYGHLNNAVYYELFDAAINALIIENADFDPVAAGVIGVVAETGCRYFRQVGFPQTLQVGLRVERLGTSSVTYGLALFAGEGQGEHQRCVLAARGRWVHVYVDRETRRPVPVPGPIRDLLEHYVF
ncbi:thioesterase family protein [Nocardia gamkensis]|uniref:acyl-CoA thioesterase n=1 Tax=Nocardia gamkensis TaxID=352869 RepID=UPI0033DB3709